MGDLFQETVLISIFAATIRIATPLIFAALGELITEKAGILNLGVEGTMLMAAFAGFAGAFVTGNTLGGPWRLPWRPGGLMAFLMVFMAATLKVEQVVTGLALNMLAAGMSLYLFKVYFETLSLPTAEVMPYLPIPVLADIPWLGPIFFQQKGLTYMAFLMVPAVWFFLYRTKWGLEIRALGENPKVIDTKGMSVTLRQYGAVILGGVLIGIGGGFRDHRFGRALRPRHHRGPGLAGAGHRDRRQLAAGRRAACGAGLCLPRCAATADPGHRRGSALSDLPRAALCHCDHADGAEKPPRPLGSASSAGHTLFPGRAMTTGADRT
jgi:ABC-type uncharacterized transport system permease subunit